MKCRGNRNIGIVKINIAVPKTTKPIHHAPIHRGSFMSLIPGSTGNSLFLILFFDVELNYIMKILHFIEFFNCDQNAYLMDSHRILNKMLRA